MSSDVDLTFGVELEFIVVYHELAFETCAPDRDERLGDPFVSAIPAIMSCMERAGIGAMLSDDDYDEEDYRTALSQPSGKRYRKWTVSRDICELSRGERAHLPPGYLEETVELSSRVFAFNDGDSHRELASILNVLNKMKVEYGCEIFTNSTTGHHVHIGRRDGAELPLQLCKRIFQLGTAHERNIDAMHMASRVIAPVSAKRFTNDLLPLYMPPSAIHRHATCDTPGANLFEWLERIERVGSLEALKTMFMVSLKRRTVTGHFSAYNFDNLGEGIKNTVEFRQHAGTLDRVEIFAWVSFVCRFVQYCSQTPDVQFVHLSCRATDLDFKLIDFLIALDVHTDVLMHYNRDGGEALLGIIPSRSTYQLDASFNDLIAQNDHEQEQNIAPETVDDIIARKSAPGVGTGVSFLGLIPSAGVVHCHESEHIRQLLEKAYQRAQRTEHLPDEQSNATIGFEGYARALVFEKLSSIYADQESGAERAVQHHLADWL
ncbi:uncharacterized protein CLAFUR5_05130 [Fulvia fulva]|uniref:Uncharacterized protein n=1 Tax=Passalora fulva TaxID=5499 RepID=A0A9Q8P845_PASFU|nr:uncharacterized protein CLAFUR5_05130 [Fulvia fulva]KAK4616488.1 hypothetical protein CLAFUR0_10524 [Fulvia fulva]UJO16711.1 hypothetical protein CLAFUR5_05130 [Fulvia fulva]